MEQKDHDLLIKVSEQILDLREKMMDFKVSLATIDKKFDNQNIACNERHMHCAADIGSKLDTSWFKWIIVLIVSGLISIAGLATSTRLEVEKLSKSLKLHQMKIEDHYKKSEYKLDALCAGAGVPITPINDYD